MREQPESYAEMRECQLAGLALGQVRWDLLNKEEKDRLIGGLSALGKDELVNVMAASIDMANLMLKVALLVESGAEPKISQQEGK